jgi:hypothetical protein
VQGEDGLDDVGDAGGGAPKFAEESPGLEGGHGLLDECADLRVGAVDGLLTCGQRLPAAPVGQPYGAAGAPVAFDAPIDVK